MAADQIQSREVILDRLRAAEMMDVMEGQRLLRALLVRGHVLLLVEKDGKEALMLVDLDPESPGVSIVRGGQVDRDSMEAIFERKEPVQAFLGLRARLSRVLAEDDESDSEDENEPGTLN